MRKTSLRKRRSPVTGRVGKKVRGVETLEETKAREAKTVEEAKARQAKTVEEKKEQVERINIGGVDVISSEQINQEDQETTESDAAEFGQRYLDETKAGGTHVTQSAGACDFQVPSNMQLTDDQLRVLRHIIAHPSLLVIWPTGSGKTLFEILGAFCLRKLNIAKRFLFVMPKTVIRQFAQYYDKLDMGRDYPVGDVITSVEKLRTWNRAVEKQRAEEKRLREAKRLGTRPRPLARIEEEEEGSQPEREEDIEPELVEEEKIQPEKVAPRRRTTLRQTLAFKVPLSRSCTKTHDWLVEEARIENRRKRGEIKGEPPYWPPPYQKQSIYAEEACPEHVALFIDEGHMLKQPQFGDSMMRCAERAIRRIILTATPLVNSPDDLINQLKVLFGGQDLPSSADTLLRLSNAEFSRLFRCRVSYMKEDESFRAKFPRRRDILVEIPMTYDFYVGYRAIEANQLKDATKDVQAYFSQKATRRPGLQSREETVSKPKNLFRFYHGLRKAVSGLLADQWKNPRINAMLQIIEFESDEVLDIETQQPLINPETKLPERVYHKGLIYAEYIAAGVLEVERAITACFHPLQIGLVVRTMHGQTPTEDREKIRDEYNRAKDNFIIIMSRVAAHGLHFLNTDYIILSPGWNESISKQVSGRGIRYLSHEDEDPENPGHTRLDATGQRVEVRVYLLITVKPTAVRSAYQVHDVLGINPEIWTVEGKLHKLERRLPTSETKVGSQKLGPGARRTRSSPQTRAQRVAAMSRAARSASARARKPRERPTPRQPTRLGPPRGAFQAPRPPPSTPLPFAPPSTPLSAPASPPPPSTPPPFTSTPRTGTRKGVSSQKLPTFGPTRVEEPGARAQPRGQPFSTSFGGIPRGQPFPTSFGGIPLPKDIFAGFDFPEVETPYPPYSPYASYSRSSQPYEPYASYSPATSYQRIPSPVPEEGFNAFVQPLSPTSQAFDVIMSTLEAQSPETHREAKEGEIIVEDPEDPEADGEEDKHLPQYASDTELTEEGEPQVIGTVPLLPTTLPFCRRGSGNVPLAPPITQSEETKLQAMGTDWMETLDEYLLDRSWQKEEQMRLLLKRLEAVSIENNPGCELCTGVLTETLKTVLGGRKTQSAKSSVPSVPVIPVVRPLPRTVSAPQLGEQGPTNPPCCPLFLPKS